MGSSMVRVDDKVHETLRRLSKEEDRSISQIVGDLVAEYDTQAFWKRLKDDYRRVQEHPETWDEYQLEVDAWQASTGDTLADEEPYYTPEEEEEIRAFAKSQGW